MSYGLRYSLALVRASHGINGVTDQESVGPSDDICFAPSLPLSHTKWIIRLETADILISMVGITVLSDTY